MKLFLKTYFLIALQTERIGVFFSLSLVASDAGSSLAFVGRYIIWAIEPGLLDARCEEHPEPLRH